MAESAHEHENTGDRKLAPGDLALVQLFVNTLDIEDRIEKLHRGGLAARVAG